MAKKRMTAALIILAVAAAFFVIKPNNPSSAPQTPNALPPCFTAEGKEYIISSYLEMEDGCPEGFVLDGRCSVAENEWDYYTSEQQPHLAYVHQEIYNNVTQKADMKYVRYVDSRIRGVDYISCGGSLYVSMWSADGHMTEQQYDRVQQQYGLRLEGMPPAEFEYAGRAEFTGYDTLPQTELGCNTGSPEVYLHSTDRDILLASISWNTAPHGKEEESRHTGFNVYVKCESPMG